MERVDVLLGHEVPGGGTGVQARVVHVITTGVAFLRVGLDSLAVRVRTVQLFLVDAVQIRAGLLLVRLRAAGPQRERHVGGALQPDRVVVAAQFFRIGAQGEPHTDDWLSGIGVVGCFDVGDSPVQGPSVGFRKKRQVTPGLHVLGNVLVPVDGDAIGFGPDVETPFLLVPHALDEFTGLLAGLAPLVIIGQLVKHPEQTHHVDVVFGRVPGHFLPVGPVAGGEAAGSTAVAGFPQQPLTDAQRTVTVLRILGDMGEMGKRHSSPCLVAGCRSRTQDVRHTIGVEEVLGPVGVSHAPITYGILRLHLQERIPHVLRPLEGIGVVLAIGVGNNHQRVVIDDGVVPGIQMPSVITRRQP